MQERANRRKASIAVAHRMVPLAFQMIEEGQDQGGIQVGEHEALWRLAPMLLGKLQH